MSDHGDEPHVSVNVDFSKDPEAEEQAEQQQEYLGTPEEETPVSASSAAPSLVVLEKPSGEPQNLRPARAVVSSLCRGSTISLT